MFLLECKTKKNTIPPEWWKSCDDIHGMSWHFIAGHKKENDLMKNTKYSIYRICLSPWLLTKKLEFPDFPEE